MSLKEKFTKKFIIWQVILLGLVGVFFFLDYKQLTIILGLIEAIVLYGTFRTKAENQYVLPAAAANKIKTISLQTQYEGDILSKCLVMIGMTLTLGYTIFFTNQSWWFKGFLAFDLLAGLGLFFFALTTSYQQYVNYMSTMKLLQGNIIQEEQNQNPPIEMKGGITNE